MQIAAGFTDYASQRQGGYRPSRGVAPVAPVKKIALEDQPTKNDRKTETPLEGEWLKKAASSSSAHGQRRWGDGATQEQPYSGQNEAIMAYLKNTTMAGPSNSSVVDYYV